MKRKIVPILVVAVILGLLFDIFFYSKQPGISVFLYVASVFLITLGLADRFSHRLPKNSLFLMPVALFFAAMIAVRANELLTFWNLIISFYLLLLISLLIWRPAFKLRDFDFQAYLGDPLRLLPAFIRESRTEIGAALSNIPALRQKSNAGPYIRGALISLPILLVFIVLLSSADLVFQRFFNSLFDVHINGEIVLHSLLVLAVSALFVGAFSLLFIRPAGTKPDRGASKKILGTPEVVILLGSVGLLFLAFVVVQIRYLFAGSGQVLTTGLTYAQYARRGFFELIAVAVITMALIWGTKQLSARRTESHEKQFLWLSGILIAEVLVIMLSAHLRLTLYENAYGFTTLRLLSHVFLVLLAITFVSLYLYIWKRQPDQRFAFRTFASVLVFFAVFNLINPDALIAKQNIDRLEKTGKIDAYYLMGLSADATPAISRLLTHSNPKIRDTAAASLSEQRDKLRCETPWQSFNVARSRAKNVLEQKPELLRQSGVSYICT